MNHTKFGLVFLNVHDIEVVVIVVVIFGIKNMKIIVFTTRSGRKIDFGKLTGLNNLNCTNKQLIEAAKTAMEVDKNLISYEIIEEAK